MLSTPCCAVIQDAGGCSESDSDCRYTLVQADGPVGQGQRFGGKIWVKGSMLRDHYLSEHMSALLRLQAQLVEQAALQAA